MRTDTKTFRNRVYRDLRAEGLTAAKARQGTNAILRMAGYFGNPEIEEGARVRISFDSTCHQSVYMDCNGVARFHCEMPEELQPLVSTKATDAQLELSEKFYDLICNLYSAEEGSKELEDARAAYEANKAAILAINPFVSASIADPDRHNFYSDYYKSMNGFRPRGYIRCSDLDAEIASLRRMQEMEEKREMELS
jgi:hypothetical protein